MKNETAQEALAGAGFGRGREVFGFNQGTFSLIDLIDAVIDYTGQADCVIATWTAAKAEMKHVHSWLEKDRLSSARWMVDRSFLNRQPELCAHLRRVFGDENIRVSRCHAKFVLLGNEDWSVTLLTSMNLNRNARIENYLVSDCPVLFREYHALIDRVYEGQEDAAGFGDYSAVSKVMDAVSYGGTRKQKKKTLVARPW
ncbi:hypothetical protein [Chelativorans sp. Marseille-P2723]|uniref:hypothetical protein n=1 Tax=Chelativorans sp. Marseille-P2723 TaxID=2709133 RepID=UPI00156EE6A9|nr:hypothetical protein [Chelativorans sp. Marseille-P2723]